MRLEMIRESEVAARNARDKSIQGDLERLCRGHDRVVERQSVRSPPYEDCCREQAEIIPLTELMDQGAMVEPGKD